MRLLKSLRTELSYVRSFGPTVLRRHMSRLRSKPDFAIDLPDYGRVHLRNDCSDLDLARSVLVERAYDISWVPQAGTRLSKRYLDILSAGRKPVVINAGGYIGLSALWFAREWPDAQVVSVEPAASNLELLHRNLAGRPGHSIVEAALGSATGKVALSDDADGCAIQSERSRDGIEIVTVDDAIAVVPDGEPFVCSIDIEGFEKDLFAANTDWIDRFALIIIEPHDWREPGAIISRNFRLEMAPRPYEIFAQSAALFYLRT